MRKAIAALGALLVMAGVSEAVPQPLEPSLPRVEVSLLDTGTSRSLEGVACEGGSWLHMRTGTIMAVLARHPQGNFLFDAGYGTHARDEYAGFPWWARPFVEFHQTADAVNILRHGGLQPQDIRWVIPSHLHWDHANGIEDFPNAEVWATRTEVDFARKAGRLRLMREPIDQSVRWRIFQFADRPYEGFRQSYDLFGDGAFVLVPLPGHTPGSVGLFANLSSGKRIFFTGDTTWVLEGFQRRVGKSWLASKAVDSDRAQTHRSILEVADLMKRKPEIVVVPSHDARAQADLAHFPRYEQ